MNFDLEQKMCKKSSCFAYGTKPTEDPGFYVDNSPGTGKEIYLKKVNNDIEN